MEAPTSSSRRLTALLAVTLLMASAVSACNTIEGAGEDLSAAGEAVDNSAERAQGAEETTTTTPDPAPTMSPPPPATTTAPQTTTP